MSFLIETYQNLLVITLIVEILIERFSSSSFQSIKLDVFYAMTILDKDFL